jgi:competence protein ComGA
MIKEALIDIVVDAMEVNASDIHFILEDTGAIMIQYRIGNVMMPRSRMEKQKYDQLLAYIRFHAALDLAHPMQPQSGSLIIEGEDELLNCRVSILPTAKFQSLVLRVINVKMGKELEEIPFFLSNVTKLEEVALTEAGLVLIGGPTGSGKTTTAYGLINHLKTKLSKSVITIEDPIEYQQPDIVQMQVNESKGMNYDVGIKEILRHDPDVIVIGEIRDANTAKQAIRAALTGHLVISTIHAKDNLGSIHRLLDLGIDVHELAQSMVALINQRLVSAGSGKKALMEICKSEALNQVMEQVIKGSVMTIPYKTLDEEFVKWKIKTKQENPPKLA